MDNMKLAALAREIADVAPQVSKEYLDQQSAFDAKHEAEVRLLQAVIATAKPALPAISNRIGHWDKRGVLVWEGTGPGHKPLRYFVLDDGTLALNYSKCDADEASWAEVLGVIEPHVLLSSGGSLGDVIPGLHRQLTKQLGKRLPSTEGARKEAGKLKAILTLLDLPTENVDALGEPMPF
jgi:hypothetical protein